MKRNLLNKCSHSKDNHEEKRKYQKRHIFLKKQLAIIDTSNISYASKIGNDTHEELVEGIKDGIEGKSPDLLEIPEVNLRAMLTSFYISTVCQDFGSSMTFLGIPGGHSWHNIYSKNMEE